MRKLSILATSALIAVAGPAFANDMSAGANAGAAGAQTQGSAQYDAGATTGGSAGAAGTFDGTAGGAAGMDGATGSAGTTSDPAAGAATAYGTDSAGAGDANFGTVVSSIRSAGDMSADLQGIGDDATIRVVDVSELPGGDATAIDNAVNDNRDGVDSLRDQLRSNGAVTAELENQNIDVSSVVAVDRGPDGTLTVYTHGSS
ncbi:hypothetical protein ACUN0C_01800 [Faunimonas sp. B44]|uniref:hypothetical protein n=1 Tax=Faunimonas sp. B44 TaxID=3461493 RepID=UPI0040451428